jgi:hypothetical protein
MNACLSKVRLARRIRGDLITNSLKLPAANVLEILALRRCCSGFIKIHRDLEPLCDLGAHVLCHRHAVFNRHAVNRDKWNDIGRTHARMRSSVLCQVD